MKFSGIGAAALLAALALAPGAGAQSLTDALISAYRHSEQLKSQRALLRSTDEGVAQAVAARRPSIVASGAASGTTLPASGTNTLRASLSLALELTLWDGGNNDFAVEAAKYSVDAARHNLTATEQTVLLDAVTAFMNMRRDTQFLELAENSREVIAQQVQASRDRYEVGEARRTDVSQAEARLAGALSTLALRQGNLEISREAYFVAIGAYPGELLPPPPLPRLPETLAAAKAIALKTHPAIRAAQASGRIADMNVLRAEAAMKPTFKLSGSATDSSASLTGDSVSIGITGSVTLYAGGALSSALRQAQALQQKSRADIQLAGLTVTQQVTRAWSQLQIARASITARQKEVRASRVFLRGVREEASLGARTTLDVLNAERDLLKAQTDLAAARRDETVAVYSLLSAMGLLTVKHLKLGIKPYDVDENYNRVSNAPGPTDRGKLLNKILTRAGKK